MKRILSLILALILVVGLIPVQANAATDSEGFVYEVYEDHVEITGYTGNEWWPTVPAEIERKPVTTITSNAFYRIPIRSIYIPDSVTSIGFGAFSSCSLLMNIHVDKNNPSYSSDERGVLFNKDKTLLICFPSAKTDFYAIPDSVTALEYYAFRGCRNLSGVSLPIGITTIPDGAFQGCESLTSFIIPDSVTHIGEGAFAGCEGLTSIIIPARITRIDLSAFENCESLKIITFKGDPPSISSYVFDYLTATAYYPADNPNWTEDRIEYLYSGYTWSKNITWVPHTHEYIGDVTEPTCTEQGYTTYTCYCTDSYVDDYTEPLGHSHTDGTCFRCGEIIYKYEYTVYEDHVEITNYTGSATQIVIPSEIEGLPVTTIGGFAFFYSTKLTSIVIPDSVTYIGGEAFYSCDSLTDIVFPDSVTYIDDYAFACCDNLTSVFIPDSVAHIGEAAFYAGYSLTEFHVDENNPYFSNDDRGVLYDKEKTKLIQAPCAIEGSYVIPDGVTTIGNYSFDCSKNLTDIVIPDSVTHIGRSAFHSCPGLTNVTIPDSVTCIDVFAFGSCDNLASIFIPASVTFIGQHSFIGCLSMTGIYVDENNRNYSSDDRGVLFDKEKKSLIFAPGAIEGAYVIPDGVTSIGYSAFDDCSSLTDVTIPDSVTSLGEYAFSGCSNLTSICFEGNAPEFGNNSVFYSVTATAYYPIGNDTWTADVMQNYSGTITWKPRDPDHIHEYTAVVTAPTCTEQGYTTYTCACGDSYVDDYVDILSHSYTAVVTEPTCTERGYTTYTCACGDSYVDDYVEPGHLYTDGICIRCGHASDFEYTVYADHVEITGYSGNETDLVIPGLIEWLPVTVIGYAAFNYCKSLTTVTIPDSVTSIGIYAFANCSNLTNVVIPDSVTSLQSHAFDGCSSLSNVVIPDSITSINTCVFRGCTSLSSVVLPDHITSIQDYAFDGCKNLDTISLPSRLSRIGNYAFTDCESLAEIQIPERVYSIGTGAFSNCSSLTEVHIPNGVTSIGAGAFSNCSSLTGIHVDENNPYFSNDDRGVLFDKNKTSLLQAPGALKGSYAIDESVTTIADSAFYGCAGMTDIDIPDTVTLIGSLAFCNCASLTSIVIPDGITTINIYTFEECSSLASIDLPDSVTSIKTAAFSGCTSLTGIDIPDSVTDLGGSVFSSCTSLISIVIPDGVTTIGHSAFNGCTSLTSIVIPDSITAIEGYAFSCCENLTGIDLSDGLTTINNAAFQMCDKLSDISIPESVTFIGDDAFFGCQSLTSIELPAGLTSIGKEAFSFCANLRVIRFRGDAPDHSRYVFSGVTATAYYPVGNDTWTKWEMQSYGGNLTWISYDPDHTHDYIPVVTAPTCTERGYTTYTCACGESYVDDYVDALGHSYTAVVTAPTCTEQGFTTYTCACGESYVDDYVDALGHSYTAVVTNPTCTEQGFTTYTCLCGDSYTTDHVEALGHDMSQWETQTAPTCTEDGTESRSCFRCDCMESRTVDALGHEYADGTCIYCGEADPDYEAPVEPPFTDVPAGAYYEAPVLWAVENGITSGVTEDSFNPGGSCLRAQVVTFLWRAEGQPEPAIATSRFTDVKPTDFFFKPVLWAVENGITSGVSATEFGSYVTCNRAAVVTFLWRAAGMPEPVSTNNPFTDVKSTDFFYKPVLWAVENNITAGLTATTFGPTAECNRAQVVTFLYRAYN